MGPRHHELQQTTGLETWFDLPGPHPAPAPLVLRTLMTYVVMPLVTRFLRPWLGRRR